ncbi:hypothetical protein ACTOB_006074 [Actinoplanes oblitus]|uniref:Uncharacterized protein n=1 Tax=Actinoplanes oblitus TaxID=3040509 RepID=A0ABY8W8S4_9ACTN|nr:hypothetical protein [Actinoplanes oblitus]WIM94073.1 hypothetical protein ACTOB_006074 [Actinoplanes oblitus]
MPNTPNPAHEAGDSAARLPSSASTRILLLGLAFLAASVFLLYTLVLEEDYLGPKVELLTDSAAPIGVPALIGLALVAIAVRRSRKR